MIKHLIALTAFLGFLTTGTVSAETYVAGKDYDVLPQAVAIHDDKKIEVVEMFSYQCSHCNAFEPLISAWKKQQADDVDVQLIPVVFGRTWEPMARAYYVSELLGTLDKTHQASFNAIHVDRKRFKDADDVSDLFATLGVEKDAVNKAYTSFAVNSKLKQGESKLRSYQVDGVPTLIVNGKYRVTVGLAGSHQNMLKIASYLIEKERKERAK